MQVPADFGTRVRKARESRGWTQREAAAHSDGLLSQPTIQRLESGTKTPSIDQVLALSYALGIAAEELVEDHPLSSRVQVAARGENLAPEVINAAKLALLPYLQLRVRLQELEQQ